MSRILIVEDSPTQAEQFRLILEAGGFDVEVAGDAERALGLFYPDRFDLVLSDIVMPGLSGYELCQRIKAGRKGREIPVVLLSTLNDPLDIIQGLECGADNFLTKPCEPEQLVSRVRTVLSNRTLRVDCKFKLGIEVMFLGRKFAITSDKEQILDLLMSTFEDIVRSNRKLQESKAQLAAAKAELERRVAERTADLRERQRQLAEAQRIGHIGDWRWPVHADAIEWSDQMFRIFGLSPRAFRPGLTNTMAMVHAADRNELLQRINKAGTEGRSFESECRVLRPDHEVRYCWVQGNSDLDARGEVVAVFGVWQDITERKLTEIAARQSAESYRHLFNSSPDGLLVVVEGRIKLANDAALAILGANRADDLIGRSVLDIVGPEFHEVAKERMAKLASGSCRNPTMEVTLLRLDGSSIAVETSASAVMLQGAPAIHLLIRDVSQRKAVEEELRQASIARAHAERAEAQKAQAIAEAELLRQQEKSAEEASRLKSAFLAVMSHEIRTPMNAVLGLATTLLESDLSDEQRQSVMAIHDAGDGLLGILNDILDFSKLEAGKMSFESIAFTPESLMQNTASIIGARAAAKGLSIRIENDPVMPSALVGDSGRIHQVLLNLASNAVKFTETGEVVLAARLIAQSNQQATVEFSIRDTGIGVSPERIGALFTEFVQADNSINRRFGGSGLGLSICKRLVQQMGGQINVTTTLGKGSNFWFSLTLPITEASAVEKSDDRTGVETLKAKLAGRARPLRILVADDNATNRQVAAKMLKEFDIHINTVCDGTEAVVAASQFSYDLIFMDMRMPEMDGLRATRAIRASGGRLATIPIIAFTANAFPEDVKACQEAGMSDFVTKPVRKKTLISAILQALPAIETNEGAWERSSSPATPSQRRSLDEGEAVVDRSAYNEMISEIGEDAAREILNISVNEAESGLKKLRQLSCETDRESIKIQAHSLKSVAATFGLREVSGLARTLEQSVLEISGHDYVAMLDRLDAAFERARPQLLAQLLNAA